MACCPLLYRLLSALAQPVSDPRLVGCIGIMGDGVRAAASDSAYHPGSVYGDHCDSGCHLRGKRMRESIYEWMKNLAVFYLFFTAVMNFLPDGKYDRYVRHFLGLVLLLLLITPILRILGMAETMTRNFTEYSMQEELRERAWDLENSQEEYLFESYERELEEQIRDRLVELETYPRTVEVTLNRGEEVEIRQISVTVRPVCSQEKREEAGR